MSLKKFLMETCARSFLDVSADFTLTHISHLWANNSFFPFNINYTGKAHYSVPAASSAKKKSQSLHVRRSFLLSSHCFLCHVPQQPLPAHFSKIRFVLFVHGVLAPIND